MSRVLESILGAPEGASPRRLGRLLRRGNIALQVRALREVGAHPSSEAAPVLLTHLGGSAPGVRAASAWALGQLGQLVHADPLLEAAAAERSDGPRLAMAAAAVRCGAPSETAWSIISRASRREVATWYGVRHPAEAVGTGESEMARRWLLVLNPLSDDPTSVRPLPSPSLREEARLVLQRDPESRPALKALAAQQHPSDLSLLLRAQPARRTRHARTEALGSHGDPRAVPHLLKVFRGIVDPGQGFVNRRTSAEALGRLGLPSLGGVLSRALSVEALEFEGHPGAGLGIQFPVRSVILTALGECGDRSASTTLAGYLSNTHGSALGGFYLPAMDALWKLGEREQLISLLSSSEELVVANAVGVLALMGEQAAIERFKNDPRERVRSAAVFGCART